LSLKTIFKNTCFQRRDKNVGIIDDDDDDDDNNNNNNNNNNNDNNILWAL
jgi:hypothetical protein